VSEITHVVPEQLFVDEQRFGPYAFWHHLHRFRSEGSTTVVEDVVNYRLPMGVLGRIVHPFIVRPKLERIFRYRRSVVEQLMGTATTQLMS
jgi:ligand-binding SRPBCC domain-containing protein